MTALSYAASNGHMDVVRLLVLAKAGLNKGDKEGFVALHHLARLNQADMIKFLVDHGADVDMASKKTGETPLHTAVQHNQLDAVNALIKCKAKLNNVLIKSGKNAQQIARENGYVDVENLITNSLSNK